MNFVGLIKSRWFKLYILIGLVLYIIPFLYGLTNFVRYFLESKTKFSDTVDKINSVYINDDKDLAFCVFGDTSGNKNVEYLIFISHQDYVYNEKNFRGKRTSLSSINKDQIKIVDCSNGLWIDSTYVEHTIDKKYLNIDQYLYYYDIFKFKEFIVTNDTIFRVNQFYDNSYETDLVLINKIENNKNVSTSFNLSRRTYPELLNPLWYLLYIPAFILDVLLWPLYLSLMIFFPTSGR